MFDVVFYGNTLFQPVVLRTAFGYDDGDEDNEFGNLVKNIRDSGILSLISLPGYFVSIALIGSRVCFKFIQTPKYIQLQGFVIMAILYSIIAATWNILTQHHSLLVILYGSTFFFSSKNTLTILTFVLISMKLSLNFANANPFLPDADYGPNTTTFMLPSLTFSPECRSTLNGISAASGKAGALIGSIMFEPVAKKYGDGTVMFLCAFTSIFGGIITVFCCKERRSIGQS